MLSDVESGRCLDPSALVGFNQKSRCPCEPGQRNAGTERLGSGAKKGRQVAHVCRVVRPSDVGKSADERVVPQAPEERGGGASHPDGSGGGATCAVDGVRLR
eukprot:1586767-Pyramimonas_sp.AAC.1